MPVRLTVPGPEKEREEAGEGSEMEGEEGATEMLEERVSEELAAVEMRVFWARRMGVAMVSEPVVTVMEGVDEGSERVRESEGELVRR